MENKQFSALHTYVSEKSSCFDEIIKRRQVKADESDEWEIQYNSMNRDDLQRQSAFNQRADAHTPAVFCLQSLLVESRIDLFEPRQTKDKCGWRDMERSLDYIQIGVVSSR